VGDIFREIDEELRQERYERLWRSYGKYLIGIGAALVITLLGWKSWDYYIVNARQAQSIEFSNAEELLQRGQKIEAAALFAKLAEQASGGYRALSRFHQAALRADSGDTIGALPLYDALAKDDRLDQTLREAAVIFFVMLQVDDGTKDAATLYERLGPLMKTANAWRNAANELAGLIALRSGDRKLAIKHFQAIADDVDAPRGIRTRAVQVIAVIK